MEFPVIYGLLLTTLLALYGLVILAFTAGLVRMLQRKPIRDGVQGGFVSVIIPVRNEAHNITGILEQMTLQDYTCDQFEVIITDDHSEDDTLSFAGDFARRHPGFPLVTVSPSPGETAQTGKKPAIGRAVARAKGEILLLTDADTDRGNRWISSMTSGFSSPGVQMILGPVFYSNEKNQFQKIQAQEFLGLMGVTAGSANLGYPVMCNGANLAYRREAFYRAGGFGGNLGFSSGDDQFLMSGIRKRNGKGSVVFNAAPQSAVTTEAEPALAGFFHQRMRWVSKSRGYRDPVVIITGLVTYLTHFSLLAGIVAGLAFPGLFVLSSLLWLAKIFLEYPLVGIMAQISGRKANPAHYIVAQLFQLIYVPLAGMLGLALPYRWKGRKSR